MRIVFAFMLLCFAFTADAQDNTTLGLVTDLSPSTKTELIELLRDALPLYRDGRFAEALPLLKRCLEISEKDLGSNHPALTQFLNPVAGIQFTRGQFEEAEKLARRSVEIGRQHLRGDDPRATEPVLILGGVLHAKGDDAQALVLVERSLEICRRAYGEDHVSVAKALEVLAGIYDSIGKQEEGVALLEQSLRIQESVSGPEHPLVASILSTLAARYGERGDVSNGLHMAYRSVAIWEKTFGATDPQLAEKLNSLAILLAESGDLTNAVHQFKRSYDIMVKAFGVTNSPSAIILHNIAKLHQSQGEYADALGCYRRSRNVFENEFGPEHPHAIGILKDEALLLFEQGSDSAGIEASAELFRRQRDYATSQLVFLPNRDALEFMADQREFATRFFHRVVSSRRLSTLPRARYVGAEQVAVSKALLEEIQSMQAAFDISSSTTTGKLGEEYAGMYRRWQELANTNSDQLSRNIRRLLVTEMQRLESTLAERGSLVSQPVRERSLSLAQIAQAIPSNALLIDFVFYLGRGSTSHYAAYLTFPLAKDSTNLVVQRVDLGEAAPIDAAIETITRRMSAGQFRARDLAAALERLSQWVYAPLAAHLTNVSHLIVCPDGQLSRVPFEMLSVAPGGKYLIEEKTISYVGSGREVARLALRGEDGPKSKVQGPKSVVMGNPDFDLDLGSARVSRAVADVSSATNGLEAGRFQQRAGGPRSLRSRELDARGMKFAPLPGAGGEARAVAGLLGADCVLRLGKDAREAELKAVQSPRVLHLATHGFFLSDQEFKRTNAPNTWQLAGEFTAPQSVAPPFTARRSLAPPRDDWENPLIRCGIALAGANRATRITNAVAEDGLLTGLEASLLNLQGTELVILSACETGAGEVKIGEGVMSLRRAFRIAGAQTVLASHWPVSDKATSQLMTEFMRRWRAGEPRAEAWRQAQLSLLRDKSGDFSNPYFWAAFTLTGQWR